MKGGYANFDVENPLQGEDEGVCPTLSFKQRMIGAFCCLGLAFILECIAFVTLFQEEYITFAVINTIANLLALVSTLFLCGPKKQVKKMFEPTRRIATGVFLLSMVLTFVVALALKIPWLTIIMVIIQFLAMLWYQISYIPFARDAIKKLVGIS